MASLPLFDRRDEGDPGDDGFWTVSALTGQIKAALELEFGTVGLVGEISNLSRPRSGHLYFHLKDEGASIRAVMWRSAAAKVVFDLADGLAVRVRGAITVYEPRGEYQIQVRTIEPEGIGALELAFRQLCERLAREGLFDPDRKRPIPRYPRRIVLVTSPTGAAVRDFLQVAGRRWPGVEILIAPAKVQGQGAADEIAAAIALGNSVRDADVIVIARGGGSLEDLWAFNEEPVARAIYASRLPVVSGVGHEVDVTIADLVADVRALTPSEAAERCVPDARELLGVVAGLEGRLARALHRRAERDRSRLERVEDRLHDAARDTLDAARSRLELLDDRMNFALRTTLDARREAIARRAAQLEALSPLNVLARGYSLTRTEDGRVVREAASLAEGQRIVTRLARGEVVSRVQGVD
jgi:exodeoxyribonuclease VII large subunit